MRGEGELAMRNVSSPFLLVKLFEPTFNEFEETWYLCYLYLKRSERIEFEERLRKGGTPLNLFIIIR